jgi:hypothetical protein
LAVKKFALSVPPEVMDQVDEAAAERGLTRSAYLVEVLKRLANARTDAAITRKVNELFADPELKNEQISTARALSRRLPRAEW